MIVKRNMLIEWIVMKIKSFIVFCFKTSFITIYTLFFEIWSLIIKYPKVWAGMLLLFLSTLLSIKHCKVGFFINYKENIINHNYPENSNIQNKYYFNKAFLDSLFKEEGKIINDYVKNSLKDDKDHYGNKCKGNK